MSTNPEKPIQHIDVLQIRTHADRDKLLDLASRPTTFQTHEGQPFVSFFYGDGGRHILPIRSQLFRDWVFHNFTRRYKHAPRRSNVREAFEAAEAFVQIEPEFRAFVFQRIGCYGERLGNTVAYPTKIIFDLKVKPCEVVGLAPKRDSSTPPKLSFSRDFAVNSPQAIHLGEGVRDVK